MAAQERQRHLRPLASTGPRPRGRGWTKTTRKRRKLKTLQRGRDHVVADGVQLPCRAGDGFQASTGPRPRGRGWMAMETKAPPHGMLQRGRDHVVADGWRMWSR